MRRSASETRRTRHRLGAVVGLSLAVLGSLLSSACGGGSATTAAARQTAQYTGGIAGGAPRRGGMLNFAISPGFMPSTLDPAGGAVMISPQIFDQLVELLPGSTTPQPAIATSWTISHDGLTYDFKLRQGIRFSNGQPLTAADVAFTLHRMTTSANQSGQFIFPNTFRSITVVSPYEIRFVLAKPVDAMLYYLADPTLSILDAAVVSKQKASEVATNPIGSGPFMVKSYSPGKALDLIRNPYYWRVGLPYLSGINYTVVADDNERILDVRSQEDDVTDSIPYSQIGALSSQAGVKMIVEHEYAVDNLYWNDARAPMTDLKVRQALAYATPIASIIEAVYHGYAQPANTIIPKMDYWSASVPYYAYNLAKAKALMRASAAPHGFAATLYVVGGDTDSTLLGTILQSAWAQIGVRLTIRQTDPNTEETDFLGCNYQFASPPSGFFLNDVAVPDDAAGLVYDYGSGTHALGSCLNDPEENQLFQQAASTTNASLRARDFEQLQAISQSEAQLLPIAFVPVTYLVSSSVRNFSALGGGWVRFDEVYLK
jgi:peptide/nickel transport system substrate-binding protein